MQKLEVFVKSDSCEPNYDRADEKKRESYSYDNKYVCC